MKTRIVTLAMALATFSVAGVQPSFRDEALADETSLADILAALRSQDSKTRAAAADHLGRKGATDTKVLEALLRALNDSDDDVRQSAAASLQQVGPPSVSYLRKALDSKSARVRALAPKQAKPPVIGGGIS
jgi:HEAT repeat protein